jgi:hypothetical protein
MYTEHIEIDNLSTQQVYTPFCTMPLNFTQTIFWNISLKNEHHSPEFLNNEDMREA